MSRRPKRSAGPGARSNHGRRDQPRPSYAVPGERAVRELLEAAPERIRRVLHEAGRVPEDVLEALRGHGVVLEVLDRERLWEHSGGADPRGLVALADPPASWPLDALIERTLAQPGHPRVLVALDSVVDPQNLGAIVRSCEFFGAAGAVWTKDRAASLTASAVRASAGATERLPHGVVTNLASALRTCKEGGLWVVGTVVDGGEDLGRLCHAGALPDDIVLVMGSEERGLRRLTRDLCDVLVTMPGRGALGSLNVSAAAAAVLAMITANRS